MPEQTPRYTIDDLVYLMARLRDPEVGCPWDIKQTFQTIAPHTVEEVYEVVDAIETGNYQGLREELGDLLFQVVFYSRLGEEQALFSLKDIISTLVKKLIIRHPHVFPDGTLQSKRNPKTSPDEAQIGKTWETIKKTERNDKGQRGLLDDIPSSLPALVRAAKLQKRAANHGFDWPSHSGVLAKINEELQEVREAIDTENATAIEEEIGDLLFSVINLSRHLRVDGETALRKASRKFESRFAAMEQLAIKRGLIFEELSGAEQEQLWDEVKSHNSYPDVNPVPR